jgi:hypothetical protein
MHITYLEKKLKKSFQFDNDINRGVCVLGQGAQCEMQQAYECN